MMMNTVDVMCVFYVRSSRRRKWVAYLGPVEWDGENK